MPRVHLILSVFILSFGAATAQADTILLSDAKLNINGAISLVDTSLFDPSTGFGELVITLSSAGSHYVAGFFDYDVLSPTSTFFDEYGVKWGTRSADQSWEIDEPGWGPPYGDIYTNFENGLLDNNNGVLAGSLNDVSMALGWNFKLDQGQIATITFLLSGQAPTDGFYLEQIDPESGVSIYFSEKLTITSEPPNQVPEPGTVQLLGSGLIAVIVFSGTRRR